MGSRFSLGAPPSRLGPVCCRPSRGPVPLRVRLAREADGEHRVSVEDAEAAAPREGHVRRARVKLAGAVAGGADREGPRRHRICGFKQSRIGAESGRIGFG